MSIGIVSSVKSSEHVGELISMELSNQVAPQANSKFQLKKTTNYESILSLLVKIYFKNKTEAFQKESGSSSSTGPSLKFDFLNSKISARPEFDRIGDENDFIMNILEKASSSCVKCRLNVETSLDTLNNLNKRIDLDSLSAATPSGAASSISSVEALKLSPTDDDIK